MCLCSKQSSLFSFYALPSGGKLKGTGIHCLSDVTHLIDLAQVSNMHQIQNFRLHKRTV